MGLRVGRVLTWWVILFLLSYVILQLPATAASIITSGLTFNGVLTTIMVAGLIVLTLFDAILD